MILYTYGIEKSDFINAKVGQEVVLLSTAGLYIYFILVGIKHVQSDFRIVYNTGEPCCDVHLYGDVAGMFPANYCIAMTADDLAPWVTMSSLAEFDSMIIVYNKVICFSAWVNFNNLPCYSVDEWC